MPLSSGCHPAGDYRYFGRCQKPDEGVHRLAGQILRECTRFQRIPCDSQFGGLLKRFHFASVASIVELETTIHQMRGRVWKTALRSGKSTVYALKQITIDLEQSIHRL